MKQKTQQQLRNRVLERALQTGVVLGLTTVFVVAPQAIAQAATQSAATSNTNASGAAAQAADRGSRVYPTDLTDIALASNGGRIVASSSTLNDDKSYDASNLIGGRVFNPNDKTTPNGWVSNKYDSINMESVTFGFADNAQKTVGKIAINPNAAVTPERWAKDIEIQVSTDSAQGPYRAIAQITVKRAPTRQEFLFLPAAARFVKLVFRSNWGSDRAVALGTVEMYESISDADPVGDVITRLESAVTDLTKFRDAQSEIANATGSARQASTNVTSTNVALANAPLSRTTQISAQKLPFDVALLKLVAGESSTRSATGARAVNIAAAANGGKIVAVSSIFNNDAEYSASNLIDGQNFSTSDGKGSFGWASEGFVPGQPSVTIGFRDDRTHVISRLVLNPVSKQNSLRWASRIEVQITSGGATEGPFRTVATLTLRPEATNQDFTIAPVEAKYVRFVFVANGPGNPLPQGDPNVSSDRAVSLGEIEIYEPAASSGELNSLVGRFNQILLDLKTLRKQQKMEVGADVVFEAAPKTDSGVVAAP